MTEVVYEKGKCELSFNSAFNRKSKLFTIVYLKNTEVAH